MFGGVPLQFILFLRRDSMRLRGAKAGPPARRGTPRRELPCASPCKTCRNRGSFFFESDIESSIESGYIQMPRAESKRVALVQSDSGGDDGRHIGEMEFRHCGELATAAIQKGRREYSSPFSHDRAAKSVSGSAWTVGNTIAPGFGPWDESDRRCSRRSSRLRLPGW